MKRIYAILAAVFAIAAVFMPSGAFAGGGYTVTYYCSVCNSPANSNIVALSGSYAYVGSCASNEFPLGSYIQVEGLGTFYVNDRMGRSGTIDIYVGNTDVCRCAGRYRANAWRIS